MKNKNRIRSYNTEDVVDDQELLRYLKMEMSADDQHAFELKMEDNVFLQEAVEGLEMTDENKIPDMIAQINSKLKKQVKQKRKRNPAAFNQKILIWITVLILLLFVFVAWWVIHTILR